MLSGYKVYIVAAAAVLYAGTQLWAGNMDMNSAMMMILAALGAGGMRAGMSNETKVQLAAKGIVVPATPSLPAKVEAVKAQAAKIAPTLLTLFLIGSLVFGSVTACATPGLTPQQSLNLTEAAFALAEASYDGICSVHTPPGFCTDPDNQANYAKAKKALQAAFEAAQAAIDLSGNINSAGIQHLIQAAEDAWAAYNDIVKKTEAKAMAIGIKVQARGR